MAKFTLAQHVTLAFGGEFGSKFSNATAHICKSLDLTLANAL